MRNLATNRLACLALSALLPASAYAQGWFIQTSFSPAQSLHAIRFCNSSTGYTVSSLYNGSTFNIYRTTNAGQTWTPQNSGYTATRFMSIWTLDPDTAYMSGNNGLIIKTTNAGQAWRTLNTGVTDQLWSIQFITPAIGYVAGSSGRIMKTTDAGETWLSLPAGVINALSSVCFLNRDTGYVSGSALVLKTTNGGSGWTNLNAPYISGFENFREIVFTDVVTGYYVSDLGRILKTTDAGATWNLLNTGTTEALFGMHFTDPSTATVCGYSGTILRTTNAGASWSPQVSGLNEILFDVWFTSPSVGYIATWSGKILKTTNGGVTFSAEPDGGIPAGVQMDQNYPNPFNESTVITYRTPGAPSDPGGRASRPVSLGVFDLLGREVAVLADEIAAPGEHSVVWNASGLSSGVYVYRLRAGETVLARRLVFLR